MRIAKPLKLSNFTIDPWCLSLEVHLYSHNVPSLKSAEFSDLRRLQELRLTPRISS